MKNQKSGSVIVTALGVGFVLLIIIAALQTYSSQRIRATTMETRNFMALGVAEGGVNLVQSELRINPGFATHKIENSGGNFIWGKKVAVTSYMETPSDSRHNFSVSIGANGAYEGTLGNGRFKVRCGVIPCTDDTDTLNIDESKGFYKVEAFGKINNTVRHLEAIIQRRFIGREFLMFSGGNLSLIYGMNKDGGYNVFSKGHLYGHGMVEAGKILRCAQTKDIKGTDQKFEELEFIKSGVGGIFLYSPMDFSFRGGSKIEEFKLSANFPDFRRFSFSAGQEGKWGCVPKEMDKIFPPIPENVQKYIIDGTKGNAAIKVTPVDFERFKNDANKGGIIIPANMDYPLPKGFPPSSKRSGPTTDRVAVIDFGNEATGRLANPPNLHAGNGVIYSPDSLVIKGNPKQDLYIVAEGNIFVAGDFNQAGGDLNAFPEDRYGLAQYYFGDPLGDFKFSWNYKDDGDKTNPGYRLANDQNRKIRRFAMVIAKERVVYDYRNPLDCFENELFPLIKARIGHVFKGAPEAGFAKSEVLMVRAMGSPENDIGLNVSDSPSRFKDCISELFSSEGADEDLEYKIVARTDPKWSEFVEKAHRVFIAAQEAGNILKDAVLDDLTRDVMAVFRYAYNKNPKNKAFRKLVQGLIREVDKAGFGDKNSKNQLLKTYLFYPEMTTNGMFISGAIRNQKFYLGPDVAKWYDEIGNQNNSVGGVHAGVLKNPAWEYEESEETDENGSEEKPEPVPPDAPHSGFIHRMFGSEVGLENTRVDRITKCVYSPPLRRKIYDYGLPKLQTDPDMIDAEVSAFVVLTWKNFAGTIREFESF